MIKDIIYKQYPQVINIEKHYLNHKKKPRIIEAFMKI